MAYYQKKKNLYNPNSQEIFKLSRSKLELFLNCPRCFYLDRRMGIGRPEMPSFTLNVAVDTLLKKEFDIHRSKKQPHPLMQHYGIKAIPFNHPKLDSWRHNFTGIQFLHKPTNWLIFGAVDDLWIDDKGKIVVVDYKATSTEKEVSLDSEYKEAYKRQMEIYQWLLRNNGFEVSNIGYFVYCNGLSDKSAFDSKLEFDIQLIPYEGNDRWVEKKITEAKICLDSKFIPEPNESCDYCKYRQIASSIENISPAKQLKLL